MKLSRQRYCLGHARPRSLPSVQQHEPSRHLRLQRPPGVLWSTVQQPPRTAGGGNSKVSRKQPSCERFDADHEAAAEMEAIGSQHWTLLAPEMSGKPWQDRPQHVVPNNSTTIMHC
eukprot:5895974-Pleurochrysis_carterae.AAC.1